MGDHGLGVERFLDDHEVAFDGNTSRVDTEAFQQLGDGERLVQDMWLTVEAYDHGYLTIVPPSTRRAQALAGTAGAPSRERWLAIGTFHWNRGVGQSPAEV